MLESIQSTKQFMVAGRSALIITYSISPTEKRQFTVSGSRNRTSATREFDGFTTEKAWRDNGLRAACMHGDVEITGDVMIFMRKNVPAGWVS